MTVEFVPFDPQKASPEEWGRFHAFRRLRHRETDPEDPVPQDRRVEALMKRQDPQWVVRRLCMMDPEAPEAYVGSVYVEVAKEGTPSWEDNRDNAWVDVELVEGYRRRGHGRALLQKAVELVKSQGRAVMMGGSSEADGKAFLEAIGAPVGLRGRESRLRLEDVDWSMVEEWAAEGPGRSPDSRLEMHTNLLSPDFLEEYCAIMTEVFNQMPRGEMAIGDEIFTPDSAKEHDGGIVRAGGTKLTALSREADGTLSGLTEMGYFPDQAAFAHQFMTGVRASFRGRGLGKWLKAAMLLRIREEFPPVKVIITRNATSNAPMLAINERMGFRPHKEGVMGQITVEEAEVYLRKATS